MSVGTWDPPTCKTARVASGPYAPQSHCALVMIPDTPTLRLDANVAYRYCALHQEGRCSVFSSLLSQLSLFSPPCRPRRSLVRGSLHGYVKDESGAVLPGVSVTATEPRADRSGSDRHRRRRPVPAEQPAARHLRHHGRTARLLDRPAGRHPGARRRDVHHRLRPEAQHGAGDHHRHRRLADDRVEQADDLDHARPRAHPRRADLVAPRVQRRARPGARRLVAQRRRRRRPPLLLLQGRRDLLARVHARRRAGRLVPRFVGPLDRRSAATPCRTPS